MDLTHTQRRILQEMPDLSFGQVREDYIKHCMSWARDVGHSSLEVMGLAKIKWQSWEVEHLLSEVEQGDHGALQKAVIMLLKDRYLA